MAEINGYAPGNYVSECFSCHKLFEGDKHAVRCFSCAVSAQKQGQIALETQLAAKTEERERLREDQKRLEFLANKFGRIVQFALSPHWAVMWNQGDDETERFLDWRDAIDAAIAMHNSGGGDG